MSAIREVYKPLHADKAEYSVACEIPLTRGFVALVDPEDFERFGRLNWMATSEKMYRTPYACAHPTRGITILLHRLIADCPTGKVVDHINGNTLDNRRQNLRIATRQQNAWNRQAAPRNPHGYTGIRAQASGNFVGFTRVNGKTHYTVTTRTAYEAAVLRDELVVRLHGEFAALTFKTANLSERGNQ